MITKKNNNTREISVALAVLIITVAIVATATATNPKKNVASKSTTTANVKLSTTKATASATYNNGMFTATGYYDSPGGPEAFTLKVTLTNDVITDTSAVSGSHDATSRIYQQQFIAGYKQLIVGKKISDVKLGVVSGSSLTSQGFNQDITKIKQEAKQG